MPTAGAVELMKSEEVLNGFVINRFASGFGVKEIIESGLILAVTCS